VRFALNRKKKPVLHQGQPVQSRAEQQGLYQLLECLPAFAARAFEGTLSIQDTAGVPSSAWPSLQFRFPEIAAACNRFYRAHLDREMGLMRSMGYLDAQWADRMEGLFSGPVGHALEANRAFLLRVGRHSGAESVTLNGVRNIRIMKGKGDAPDFLDEAKTLWLAGDERQSQRDLLPFGWILIEAFQRSDELCEWPGSLRNADMGAWRERVLRRSEVLQADLEAQQQREADTRRAAEAAEQEAREREERLAAMSEEERRIESLRETLAREREVGTLAPNSRVASERVELLRDALEWDADALRQRAAEAIQETVRALPWSKKSKAERQAELARLRSPKAPE
jgi:CRISPR-associated protein Csm5